MILLYFTVKLPSNSRNRRDTWWRVSRVCSGSFAENDLQRVIMCRDDVETLEIVVTHDDTRATNHRALLRKMTYKDKTSYDSTPPCNYHSTLEIVATHDDTRATSYRALLRKMTYKDMTSYDSTWHMITRVPYMYWNVHTRIHTWFTHISIHTSDTRIYVSLIYVFKYTHHIHSHTLSIYIFHIPIHSSVFQYIQRTHAINSSESDMRKGRDLYRYSNTHTT